MSANPAVAVESEEKKTMKQIMTTKDVALATGVPASEIRRLNREGVLKSLRGFRKPKKYSIVAVKKWLEGE